MYVYLRTIRHFTLHIAEGRAHDLPHHDLCPHQPPHPSHKCCREQLRVEGGERDGGVVGGEDSSEDSAVESVRWTGSDAPSFRG